MLTVRIGGDLKRLTIAEAEGLMCDLQTLLLTPQGGLNPFRIQAAVAAHFVVPIHLMIARDHTPRAAWPRQVAMALCRDLLKLNLHSIGREFRRDHGTVLHACRAVAARCETEDQARRDVAALKERLENMKTEEA
jgi:chromosomal replication initiator protein